MIQNKLFVEQITKKISDDSFTVVQLMIFDFERGLRHFSKSQLGRGK